MYHVVDPMVYSQGKKGHYFFYSNFNDSGSIKVDIRLWDEGDWRRGIVYIYLSGLDTYANSSEIDRWKSGVEIMLSNSGSGVISDKDYDIRETRDILSGVKWTTIEVTWFISEDVMVLQVFQNEKVKPFLMVELEIKDTILSETSFRYLSLSGSPSLWNLRETEGNNYN